MKLGDLRAAKLKADAEYAAGLKAKGSHVIPRGDGTYNIVRVEPDGRSIAEEQGFGDDADITGAGPIDGPAGPIVPASPATPGADPLAGGQGDPNPPG